MRRDRNFSPGESDVAAGSCRRPKTGCFGYCKIEKEICLFIKRMCIICWF